MRASLLTGLLGLVPVSVVMPAAALAQDSAAGERLFRTRCASCHALEAGQNRIGPSLSGVIGRAAGAAEGARYSQGLRDLAVAWDTARLDAFLANPRAMVKGTTMTVSVPGEADRAAIIAYLAEAAVPPAEPAPSPSRSAR